MQLREESWSSTQLPPSKQLSGFQEVFDRTHFHWGLRAPEQTGYAASVRRRDTNEFVFTHIYCDPVAGFRTIDDVKKSDDHYFCLLYFDGGVCRLRQGRNETVVRPDSIAVWDSTRPAEFENNLALDQYSILIPYNMGRLLVPGIEDMSGLSVDGSAGLGAVLLSHLRQIHRTIDAIDPQDRPAVLRATVELIGAAFRPSSEQVGSSTFRRALLNRVQDYVLAHLGDPGLSAANIASAFRFSPRYLHRLFEEFDVTVGTWIRKRRLDASSTDLVDRKLSGLSITEIAMRHGFADASHFSHAFKHEYGMSPRDFRRLHAE